MKVKVTGLDPVNVEFSLLQFTVYNSNMGLEPIIHFSMTEDEARELRDTLTKHLSHVPKRVSFKTQIINKFCHSSATNAWDKRMKEIEAEEETEVKQGTFLSKDETAKEASAKFWASMDDD